MKRITALLLALSLLAGCSAQPAEPASAPTEPSLPEQPTSAESTPITTGMDFTVNGQTISDDPTQAVYAARDIIYYPEGQDHTFGEGTADDAHSEAEASKHTVIHITQPGSYRLKGQLTCGQIAVDLGEGAEDDPNAVVELILDGVAVDCSVAPAVIFYRVYECDPSGTANPTPDLSGAGARVTMTEGTDNFLYGSYVAKIYDPDSLVLAADGTVEDAKKLHKYDGALYSKMSMVIGGEGRLSVLGKNEGIGSELHLAFNGGHVDITARNDCVNANEDGLSVITVNGGNLNAQCNGLEGDGIDSNGYLVINGGEVHAHASTFSADSGVDADLGVILNGGTLITGGNMLDNIQVQDQVCAVFQFLDPQKGNSYALIGENGHTGLFTAAWGYTYVVITSPELVEGTYFLERSGKRLSGYKLESGMGGFGGPHGQRPEDMGQNPGDMELPEGMGPAIPGEPGEMPEGMIPAFPAGDAPPEGEIPAFPANGGRPEGGRDHGGFGGQVFQGETTTEFVMETGINHFVIVSEG